MLSKSSNWDLLWLPPSRGGNSISIFVKPSPSAASIARLAVLRNSAWISILFESDFSKGDIPFGMGDNCCCEGLDLDPFPNTWSVVAVVVVGVVCIVVFTRVGVVVIVVVWEGVKADVTLDLPSNRMTEHEITCMNTGWVLIFFFHGMIYNIGLRNKSRKERNG